MLNKNFWQKIHREQEKSGWCGVAIIQMLLEASGIEKSQKEIKKDVYLEWLGVDPYVMTAYLARFFKNLGYKEQATIADIERQLKLGRLVVVDWWDDLDPADPEGHYCLVSALDKNKGILTFLDPSEGRGIWDFSLSEFKKRWYDYIDVNYKLKLKGFLLWLDPRSKI